MKHIIILGDGMADHPVEALGGKTLLQYADTPALDRLAALGRCGMLQTIPDGFQPGSEVANASILGYDLTKAYEGRGPLEAASIGYDMEPGDMAIRCNIVTLGEDGEIVNHHGGHLDTPSGALLIHFLNERLGSDRVKLIPGIHYRHLLVIKGGNKHIECAPPHDHPGEQWRSLLVRPDGSDESADPAFEGRMTARETADLINGLIVSSQELLKDHPFNIARRAEGKPIANSIWPWSPGYRPDMMRLEDMYPRIRSGVVITAVDLIRGIGIYAGLTPVDVKGATGLADTNYEGKAAAAIEALRRDDFVFLHIEASDEAGHDGDLQLKLQTIENLDRRIVAPILEEIEKWDEPVSVALLPDHPTPVELRIHLAEPVPFVIYTPGVSPDSVKTFDEVACAKGSLGTLRLMQFMHTFMKE